MSRNDNDGTKKVIVVLGGNSYATKELIQAFLQHEKATGVMLVEPEVKKSAEFAVEKDKYIFLGDRHTNNVFILRAHCSEDIPSVVKESRVTQRSQHTRPWRNISVEERRRSQIAFTKLDRIIASRKIRERK
jgi:hypothetical protein